MPEETENIAQNLTRAWQVAKRRRWSILLTFGSVTLTALLASYLLPAKYRSEATIIVEQQHVPEKYVTPTSTMDVLQALQAMTQDILSRANMLQIINEFDLYSSEKSRLGPDELVQEMRKDIEIEPLLSNSERRVANAFKISYMGRNPRTTQQVTGRLTSLFIAESLRANEVQAKTTTNFLQDQLKAAEADLQAQEKRLRDFKMQHPGELPQYQQGNLEILSGLQMQMQNSEAALGRARQQQVYLESLLAQYHNLVPKTGTDPNQTAPNRVATVEKQLNELRTQRTALVAHYTLQHPDVVNLDRQISETEDLLEILKKNQKAASGEAGKEAAALQITEDDDPAVAQLKSQLKANHVEIGNLAAQQKALQGQIAEYQRRLNLTPVREQELAEILRNYNLSQANYNDLEAKKTQSQLATRLQQDQQGQQFRLVDPANFPSRPISPDRRKLALAGLGLGLVLGAGLGFLQEMRDTSFHSQSEVNLMFALPFVLGIPELLNTKEEKQRAHARALEWTGGLCLVTLVLITDLLVLWRG